MKKSKLDLIYPVDELNSKKYLNDIEKMVEHTIDSLNKLCITVEMLPLT